MPPIGRVAPCWTVLAHPEEQESRSKTGEFDVSIPLDSSWCTFMAPVWKQLRRDGGTQQLWSFDYPTFCHLFKKAKDALRIPTLVPYQMRHSGPSIDRSRDLRSMREIPKRGQWRCHRSLTRYEKNARLAFSMMEFSQPQQLYFHESERRAAEIVLHGKTVPWPSNTGL